MNPDTCKPSSPSTALGMRKQSHVVSKFKPKIRIVHIFAPEIIKTDVANFRELVQRLTGKPAGRRSGKKKKTRSTLSDISESDVSDETCLKAMVEMDGGGSGGGRGLWELGCCERVKKEMDEEEEMWRGENSNCFGGLGDLDCLFQGFSELPLIPSSSSHLDVFGETSIS